MCGDRKKVRKYNKIKRMNLKYDKLTGPENGFIPEFVFFMDNC
jgi:hypothetical protein